jgi:long-subunit acyl-CoA synthetase (AMP-forming)
MANFTVINENVFTLANGQKVDTVMLEREIGKVCHYVEHVVIVLRDGKYPVAMIFPNRSLWASPDYDKSPEEGCFCPRNLTELGRCLSGCMHTTNLHVLPGYATVDAAVIINIDLSVTDGTLSADMKPVSGIVIRKYAAHLENLYGGKVPVTEQAFNMNAL